MVDEKTPEEVEADDELEINDDDTDEGDTEVTDDSEEESDKK